MKYIIYAKENTRRFFMKNYVLAPMTLDYLKRCKVPREDILIVGNCIQFFEYCINEAGMMPNQNLYVDTAKNLNEALKDVRDSYPDEDIILLLPCSPFREMDLLEKVEKTMRHYKDKIVQVCAMKAHSPDAMVLTREDEWNIFGIPAKVEFKLDDVIPFFHNSELSINVKFPYQLPFKYLELFEASLKMKTDSAFTPEGYENIIYIDNHGKEE